MTAIYALLDPRTNEVRYVGKAKDPKLRYASHKCVRGYSHRANWIRSLQQCGYNPEMVILEETVEWAESELFWIDYLRSLGARLTNLSKGGESGPVGWSPTAEQRKKMSDKSKARIEEARKFPLLHQGVHAFVNRKPPLPTDEQRKAISERSRHMWADPDVKAKMSAEISERHKRGVYKGVLSKGYKDWTEASYAKASRSRRLAQPRNALGLKGVTAIPKSHCYSAHAMLDERTYLGCFHDPHEAAKAVDAAMYARWGADTFLNFPIKDNL